MKVGIGLRRIVATVPDLVTMGVFALAWIDPRRFGLGLVVSLMVVMLLEFIVMHAGVVIGTVTHSRALDRQEKTRRIGGFGLLYGLFAVAWAVAFRQPWVVPSFAWLLLGKVAAVWLFPVPAAAEVLRQQRIWGYSAMAYLGGVGLTLFLPLPLLGMQPDVVDALNLPGSGAWIDEPHRVLAFGVVYFAAQAAIDWFVASRPATEALAPGEASVGAPRL